MEGEKKRELAALREAGLAKDPNWKPWRDPVFTERLYREDYAPGSAGQTGAHTPGPWRVEKLPHIERGQENLPRYRVWAGKRPVIDGFVINEEDARLFAAAPLMLEALLNARGLLDSPVARRKHAGDEFYGEVVASLRAAIAAATGEEV